MSVLAKLNFSSGEWEWKVAPESPAPDFEIGFTADTLPVEFDGLAFGFTVVANGVPALTKAYPPQGVRYVATDQEYITNDRVQLKADDNVILSVWAENGGERYEGMTSFDIPRPEQPYPSWTWNGEGWEAPVPYPTDGEEGVFYTWDEEAGDWVVFTPEES
jgi:hypothetical protein